MREEAEFSFEHVTSMRCVLDEEAVPPELTGAI